MPRRGLLLVVALLLAPAAANAGGPIAESPSSVWVEPGTVVWDRPGAHGREVARVQTVAELPVTEVAGGWVRVVYLDRSGWIERPDVGVGTADQDATSPCDQVVLATRVRCVDLGWVWLVTDLSAAESTAVESLLGALPSRYRARYGDYEFGSGATSWFAVLSRREDYDAFLEQYRHRLAVDASAVASGRVAAMVHDPDRVPVEAVVTHEGAHLINRLALGDGIPIWIEEGAAGCLALLTDEGAVPGETLFAPLLVYHDAGWSEERTAVSHAGPRAALARMRTDAASGDLPLAAVLSAGRQRFYRSAERQQNYELSSLLTCYLAERVFPAAEGGLVRASNTEAIGEAVSDDWLPADLASWADELLGPLEAEDDSGDR